MKTIKIFTVIFLLTVLLGACRICPFDEAYPVEVPIEVKEKLVSMYPAEFIPYLESILNERTFMVTFTDDQEEFIAAYASTTESIYISVDEWEEIKNNYLQCLLILSHETFHYYQEVIEHKKMGLDGDYDPEIGKNSYSLDEEATMFGFCALSEYHTPGTVFYLYGSHMGEISKEYVIFYIDYINAKGFNFVYPSFENSSDDDEERIGELTNL
jgi:hypothetical protein